MESCIFPAEIIDQIARSCDLPTIFSIIATCKSMYYIIKDSINNSPIIEWKEWTTGQAHSYDEYFASVYKNRVPAAEYTRVYKTSNNRVKHKIGAFHGWPTTYNICIDYGPGVYKFKCLLCKSVDHCVWLYDYNATTEYLSAQTICVKCINREFVTYNTTRDRLSAQFRKLTGNKQNTLSFHDTLEYLDMIGITMCNGEAYAKILSILMNKKINYKRPSF